MKLLLKFLICSTLFGFSKELMETSHIYWGVILAIVTWDFWDKLDKIYEGFTK